MFALLGLCVPTRMEGMRSFPAIGGTVPASWRVWRIGHTVNFKTRKHFKDKKSHYVDESEWTIFENTHEAIIDQETFDNVQRIRANVRRYPDGWGEAHPLTGLMYCADCGGKM